ncbi:mercury resistance system transport protein MerF [bacterium]|nr:mercury resistance system transport protein MerF [bacterium]
MMETKKLFKSSACGTCVMAICCFTPALVILLGAVGLSSWLGWLDYVLLPGLVIFLVLTVMAGMRLMKEKRVEKDAS